MYTAALGAAALGIVWVLTGVIFGLYRLRDASASDVVLAAAATTGLQALVRPWPPWCSSGYGSCSGTPSSSWVTG